MYAAKVQVGVGAAVAAIQGVLGAVRLRTLIWHDARLVPIITTLSNGNYRE